MEPRRDFLLPRSPYPREGTSPRELAPIQHFTLEEVASWDTHPEQEPLLPSGNYQYWVLWTSGYTLRHISEVYGTPIERVEELVHNQAVRQAIGRQRALLRRQGRRGRRRPP